jgi:hypothetical protein
MYESFMWLDSIYQGITNPSLKILMFLGYCAVGQIIGYLILFIIRNVWDVWDYYSFWKHFF